MTDAPSERIDKITAAERQLRVAIRLFFEHRDLIAVHTLTAAAHTVLRDLCRRAGRGSLLKDLAPIREDKKREWIDILNAAQNFFKHADRDPDELFDFCYEGTKFFIWDAVEMLFTLKKSIPKEAFVFRTWLFTKHPEFFNDSYLKAVFEVAAAALGSSVDDFDSILFAMDSPALADRFPFNGD